MTRFPGLEAKILRTLEEEGEMRVPEGRLAQEYFWQAAAQLQAQGLAVADQQAGLVRRAAPNQHFRALREMAEESIAYHLGRLADENFDIESKPGRWTEICRKVEERTMAARREFQ